MLGVGWWCGVGLGVTARLDLASQVRARTRVEETTGLDSAGVRGGGSDLGIR